MKAAYFLYCRISGRPGSAGGAVSLLDLQTRFANSHAATTIWLIPESSVYKTASRRDAGVPRPETAKTKTGCHGSFCKK
jgi:hypothetical protein